MHHTPQQTEVTQLLKSYPGLTQRIGTIFNYKHFKHITTMKQLADLDLIEIKSKIQENLFQINIKHGKMLIHHTTQYIHQEYEGEAHIMILGFSFKPASNHNNDYYQAMNDARDTAISYINDFLETLEQPVKLVTPTSTDHVTWLSKDDDRLTLDAADDSLILTLYLSGQY